MDATERRHLLERYAEGYDAVTDALQGITERELDQQAADGWTPRQIVHHLADSETTSYIRVRRLLAEDQPVIQGYDEELFARILHYDRPIGSSLEVFRAVRRATVSLLERLTEADWARTGTHSEQGRYGVEDWLTIYANHGAEHAAQIRRARGGGPASAT
ncbi:MAG TPA: DinB family protein [Chloroflexota bacterium]|nr:DinB family protein [Chloroflexota bacterium]